MAILSGEEHAIAKRIIAEVSRVVIGKDETKELLLVALLSQGHVLIEGLPGTAKTTITRTFAYAIGGKFKRVQGTPDMLPADILGFYLYRPDGSSSFMPGPIFANVVLVDELNRTTPRTQAALLEAMQEHQVTIERATHPLELPFIVIANQIPYGGPGTSPLSEVQIDRFMFRIWSGLPSKEEEERVLKDIDFISEPHVKAVATTSDIIRLQEEVMKVHVADNIRHYIVDFLDSLRRHPDVSIGPSPRAGIALTRGARALAFLEGRDFVIPDDVKRLFIPTLSHRVRISAEADMEDVTPEAIIKKIASEIPAPKGDAVGVTDATASAAKGPATPAQSEPPIKSEAGVRPAETTVEAPMAAPAKAPQETAAAIPAASQKTKPRGLPDWGWVLVILALIVAAVMISVGLLSVR